MPQETSKSNRRRIREGYYHWHPCTRHERIARAETKFFAAGPREATRAGDGNAGTRFGDEPRIETHSSRQSVKRLSFRARKFTRSDHALDRTRHPLATQSAALLSARSHRLRSERGALPKGRSRTFEWVRNQRVMAAT